MMRKLHETDADVAISSYTLVDSESNVLDWYTPTLKDGEILDRDQVRKRFLTSLDIEGFRWDKIYKKTVFDVNGTTFRHPAPGDMPSEFDLLSHVDKAVMVGSKGYCYRQSSVSDVGTMTPAKIERFLKAYKRVGKMAEDAGFVKEARFYTVWRTVNSQFNYWKSRKTFSRQEWRLIRKTYSFKQWLGMNFFQVAHTVMEHGCKRDSRLKFLVKTVIVWGVYR
jgi:hypothetical protein